MARIFISHSSLDKGTATEIKAWLGSLGFDNAFLDIDEAAGIQVGEAWEARLYEELAACSAVVLLVTPHWLASKWCFAEFVQARATGKSIFPIILTPDGGQAFAGDLQRQDFTTDKEQGKRRLATSLTALAMHVQSGFTWPAGRPPYPGLMSFEAEDAAVYFGRDDEVMALQELLRARQRLRDLHMVVVLGPSGSGKSSLVRAGLLPRLQKFDAQGAFAVVPPWRPGTDPCTELAKALAQASGQPGSWAELRARVAKTPEALSNIVSDVLMASGHREGTLLVTIDQAEELFTACSAESRALLAQWLQVLQQLPVLLLLTLRSDFLGEWQHWAQPIGAFAQFSLPPLPMVRLGEVIEGPARVAGVRIAPGVLDAIKHDAGGTDAMPLLAFTLRELWTHAMADPASDGPLIRLADYTAIADPALGLSPLENAVRRRADELVKNLDVDARNGLRLAFVGALSRIDDQGVYGRRAATWDEMDAAVHPLIRQFVQARLLTVRSEAGQAASVEVAHESLLRKWPLLKGWLDEEQGFLLGRLQLQRALIDWQGAAPEQRDTALLQGLMLARATAWLRDKPKALNAAQRNFINSSAERQAAREQSARRKWLALGSAGVLAMALIAGLGVYLHQAQRASSALALEVEADLWTQRSAAALAYAQPERALAHAQRGFALLPSAKSRSVLWEAKLALAPQAVFAFPGTDAEGNLPEAPVLAAVAALAWSQDGDSLIVGDQVGALHALTTSVPHRWSDIAAKRRQPASKDRPEFALAVAGLAGGARMAVLQDGRILRQRAGAEGFELLEQVPPMSAAAISGSGQAVLALGQEDRQLRWIVCNAAGGCSQRAALPGGQAISRFSLDPATERFAAADDAGRIVLGDSQRGTARSVALALPADTRILALALQPGADKLAVSTSQAQVHVLDGTGVLKASLSTQGANAQQLAWAAGGERLAAACEAESLCVWRAQADGNLALAAVLAVRNGGASALAWSSDGQRLASGDVNGRLQVWDLAAAPNRSTVLRVEGAVPIASIDVHPDGRRIASADVRGQATVWDLPSQRVLQRLAHPQPGESRGLRFHPVQPQLALATLGGGLAVLGLDGAAPAGTVEGSFEALRWDTNGAQLISGGQDGVVRSHSMGSGQSRVLSETHSDAVVAVAVAPDGVVYSADTRGVVKAHGGGESGAVATVTSAAGRPFSVGSLAFSSDGQSWLAAGSSGDVLVFDRARRQLKSRLATGADQVNAAAFSPDGRFVAATDNVGRLILWRSSPFERYATLLLRNEPGRVRSDNFGQLGQLRGLAWLPDSRRLAIASQSGVVVVIALPD